ncbi:Mur ligase family protein [Actinomyces vulturis]|uniref:Mur ligase family protein n=1 Tax=Actinomyces vulturis TaxID=1857645 RepID=UPI000AA09199|nr:UDP-N-acetylmuramoyl-L-alanyl-D-glutamate--2,6-diaminopimelate ligase [Actinomyces vulturis]
MSNSAYASAAHLRPGSLRPLTLGQLAQVDAVHWHESTSEASASHTLVTGVSVDSSDIASGELFVALPGARVHGAQFASQVAKAGACAILTDERGAMMVREAGLSLPLLVCDDPRALVGTISAIVYDFPSRSLITTAVTGTNGKTTTAYFLEAMLSAHVGACMVAGTVELRVADESVPSPRTTVEAPVLQRLLALSREKNVGAASLEASSHAICLGRLTGTHIDVAGFTNLQRDHLDFHHTMEEYLQAKSQLFTPEFTRRGVVCVDDQWGAQLALDIRSRGEIDVITLRAYEPEESCQEQELARNESMAMAQAMTDSAIPPAGAFAGVSMASAVAAVQNGVPETQAPLSADPAGGAAPFPADWYVTDARVSLDTSATTFTLHGPDGVLIEASCPLPGLVNVQNAALALVMAIAVGVEPKVAAHALANAHNIPGRMQRITQRDGIRGLTIVDFAHTPDALDLALKAVRPITPGKLIVVFGSDGDRDQGKRPMLGQVAAELADVLVVTDENPRSEDPATIRQAILEGIRSVRPDMHDVEEITTWRGDAVRRGVELCGPDDTVIVTGKGHEPFLEIADEFIAYNDAPVMAEATTKKWGNA